MTHYDDRRERRIETPMGGVTIREKKWNEGEEGEHWAYVQEFKPDFDDDVPNGEVVGRMLEYYTVARQLAQDGYEVHSMLEESAILWVKYV